MPHVVRQFLRFTIYNCNSFCSKMYAGFYVVINWMYAGDACTGDVVMFEQNVYEMWVRIWQFFIHLGKGIAKWSAGYYIQLFLTPAHWFAFLVCLLLQVQHCISKCQWSSVWNKDCCRSHCERKLWCCKATAYIHGELQLHLRLEIHEWNAPIFFIFLLAQMCYGVLKPYCKLKRPQNKA